MVRKNLLRSVSVLMACMMAVMTVACGSNTVSTQTDVSTAVVETAQEEQLEKTLATAASSSASGESGKVETVYVTADANGTVSDVIVSEWLKNANASAELSDTTDLQNIENVKGSETYTDNGDGTVTWNAAGSDIYYQGTTDKELPVDMKITYFLDGKEIAPADLAGKSGKVTIRFEYENKSKQTVDVDGKQIEVYTPFAMVSGLMLDSDKFTNVEISNGKIISDGGNYIIMGVALPGLKESLNISDDKWDEIEDSEEIQGKLSNYFEITADTTDFEMGMTITMASSDILSDFGVTDIADSDKIDDLKSDMGELNDGSTKLVDGAKELKEGTGKLADGSKELKEGTGKLYDGTKELKDGTGKLSEGTGKLADGAGQLQSGASQLADGAGTLKDGTGKLADGSKSLYDGVTTYTEGVTKVNSGATMLEAGTESLQAGASKISDGAAKLQAGAGNLAEGTQTLDAGVSQLSELSNALDLISAKKDALETKQGELNATVSGLNTVEGFLTTPNMPCPDALVPTLTKLSGGKIQSAEDAVRVRDAGLAALAGEQSGENHQEPAGAEGDGGEVITGEITNPEQTLSNAQSGDDNSQQPASGDTQTPAQGDLQQPASDDTQTSAETAATPAGDTQQGGSSVTITDESVPTASSVSETGAGEGASDEKIYSQADVDAMVDKMVAEKLKEAVAEYINSDEYKAKAQAEVEATITAEVTKRVQQEVASRVGDISTYAATLASTRASKSAAQETLTFVDETLESFNAFVTDADKAQGITTFSAKVALTKQKLLGLQGGVSKLNNGAQELSTGITQLKLGVDGYTDPTTGTHVTGLAEGINQVQGGAKQLVDGTNQLVANNDKLNNGAKQLSDGAAQLDSGAGQLKDGADKLSSGAGELKSGADELNTGAGTLDNGATELMNGAKDLDDGAGKLDDGIVKVDDGVKQLLEGVTKLDEEGIKKLYEAFDGDLTEFADKLTAIQEAGTEYTSFAGANKDEDCSVKFIIKTEGVKAEDI